MPAQFHKFELNPADKFLADDGLAKLEVTRFELKEDRRPAADLRSDRRIPALELWLWTLGGGFFICM